MVVVTAAGLTLGTGVARSDAACVSRTSLTATRLVTPTVTRSSSVKFKRISRTKSEVWVSMTMTMKATFRYARSATLCDAVVITDQDKAIVQVGVIRTGKGVAYGKRTKARTRIAKKRARQHANSKATAAASTDLQTRADSLAASWSKANPVIDPRIVRSELLRLVNERRVSLGEAPLSYLEAGEALADEWAQRDADLQLVEHDTANLYVDGYYADLESLGCHQQAGVYSENLYMIWSTGLTEKTLAAKALNGWIRSVPNGGNVESSLWTWTTIGVGKGSNYNWAIVMRFLADDCSNMI